MVELRVEVDERVLADGTVHTPVDLDQVRGHPPLPGALRHDEPFGGGRGHDVLPVRGAVQVGVALPQHAVFADEGKDLAAPDLEIDALQRLDVLAEIVGTLGDHRPPFGSK